MDLVSLLITWIITSISLFIISKLPTGVEIDGFNKALISAAVFGVLNALIRPILAVLAFPITFLTLGLFSIIINAIIFGLAAWLVTGFRLRWGFWSAIIGTLALSFINSILFAILGMF
ncbi:phage holin family protein [Phormidium pseudopriestleyi FRX01]|uniref:Phage holin family protein n=1 Tax=Phormidium pseudopriestleyi FRX01 TaxID=1759528 RepID=A0ABS3FVU1_9CYAN|nr:phage holin family protein [Phormidium pseudopriestleyi]MBO0351178.1 phage holin family protein [Phormidium pseudopriestleyi FRX01]